MWIYKKYYEEIMQASAEATLRRQGVEAKAEELQKKLMN